MSMDDSEEELRIVKKKRGAHRPASKGNVGYDRDLWQGDENNDTKGPTESRPADEILAKLESAKATEAELTAAKEETERLQAERDAAKRRMVELEAEQAAHERGPVTPEPSLAEQFLESFIRGALEGALDAVEDALRTPEGRQALAALGRRAWNSATTLGRRLFRIGQEREASAVLRAQPSADAPSTRPSAVPATKDSAQDERPRTAMSREEYREYLLAFMGFKEAAARLGQVLQQADVDEADLPPELESAVQAALTGQAVDLSPEDKALLIAFLIPPDGTDDFQIAEGSRFAEPADDRRDSRREIPPEKTACGRGHLNDSCT